VCTLCSNPYCTLEEMKRTFCEKNLYFIQNQYFFQIGKIIFPFKNHFEKIQICSQDVSKCTCMHVTKIVRNTIQVHGLHYADRLHLADRGIWHFFSYFFWKIHRQYMCGLHLIFWFITFHIKVIEFNLDLHNIVPMTKLAFDKR